jgi:hypothetical protein
MTPGVELQIPRAVAEQLSAAVVEFFGHHGVACEVASNGEAFATYASELGAMVGFRGKALRGGLAFVAPRDLIAGLLPVPLDLAGPEGQLRDWTAEILNQIFGRLKNKLGMRAGSFQIGTPVSFTGSSIRLAFLPGSSGGLALAFVTSAGLVRVHLDCVSVETVGGAHPWAITDAPPSAVRVVSEGDVVLF